MRVPPPEGQSDEGKIRDYSIIISDGRRKDKTEMDIFVGVVAMVAIVGIVLEECTERGRKNRERIMDAEWCCDPYTLDEFWHTVNLDPSGPETDCISK